MRALARALRFSMLIGVLVTLTFWPIAAQLFHLLAGQR